MSKFSLLYVASNKSLLLAAERNDFMQVEELLFQGADVDTRCSLQMTPLILAAMENVDESHYQTVKILLNYGADVNARGDKGQTAFYFIVKNGNRKMVELFLNFEASFDVFKDSGYNILFLAAAYNKNVEVLQLLIDLRFDVNYLSTDFYSGMTLLHLAAMNNNSESKGETAEMLLKNGVSINALDTKGNTAVSYLVRKCNLETLQLFLSFKPDINLLNKNGESILFSAAAYNKNVEVLQKVIDLGLDLNHRNNSGQTPLHLVCGVQKNFSTKTIKCLLKNGANANAVDYSGRTPFYIGVAKFTGEVKIEK